MVPPVMNHLQGRHCMSVVPPKTVEGTNPMHAHLDNPIYCKAWPRSTPRPPLLDVSTLTKVSAVWKQRGRKRNAYQVAKAGVSKKYLLAFCEPVRPLVMN
jgi:hypothetical protein